MKRAAIAAIITLSGCATSPTYTDSSPVPSSRITAQSLTQASPGTIAVIIRRDSGFMGSACAQAIAIDGQPVASMRPGEHITLHLPEGSHILRASAGGICGGGTAETEITANRERKRAYRIASGQAGTITIMPTSP